MTGRFGIAAPLVAVSGMLLALGGSVAWAQTPEGLSQLPEPRLPEASARHVERTSLEQVAERYRRALAVAEDPALRLHIRRRLADLSMALGEREQAESGGTGPFFEEPIRLYRALIDSYQDRSLPDGVPQPDHLYYQLAKAYALDGRVEEADAALAELIRRYPESQYYAEARFRRAERAFSRSDYQNAEAHYRAVLAARGGSFAQNAREVRAWAQFKDGDYPASLDTFAELLDQLLAGAQTPKAVDQHWEAFSSAEAEVANDALRAMAVALAYLEGPEAILQLWQRIGPRPYEHRVYQRLGELYLKQERYRDSARSYAQFVTQNPDSDLAPGFSVREIEVYKTGDFPSLVLPAKQAFVRRYGLLSRFWLKRWGQPGDLALTHLHEYLGDLSNFQHARAQRLAEEAGDSQSVRRAFRHAATWYREFVASFPEDPRRVEMLFLLAETLNEAGDWPEALDAYEQVAFVEQDTERGQESGYAAVLLAHQLSERAGPDNRRWWDRRIATSVRFADHYPRDPRAVQVLSQSARDLFSQGEVARSAELAERVLAWQPEAPGEEIFSAWLVLAHSRFDLEDYTGAETAYWQVLELSPQYGESQGAPSRAQVRERIAASIYQQAQQALAAGDRAGAVSLFLTVTEKLPDTSITAQAQFDAAHHLMQLEDWPRAEAALLDFRREYPVNPLQEQLPARLATVFEAQQKWSLAAEELISLRDQSEDPELQRQSLYRAAELYQRDDDLERAIVYFRRYAHSHPQPAALRREAEYQMTRLYEQTGQVEKRVFWLNRLADHYQPGDPERAKYLAAFAASELAERSYNDFAGIALRLPLNETLPRKRQALERAIADQEKVLEYGVAEFTTRASHRIGGLYHQLSRDLMNSERPDDLDALALEQYDILLEEQAFPFEERAIEIYESNVRRAWKGLYDAWVRRSYEALAELLPARYGKREQHAEVHRDLY